MIGILSVVAGMLAVGFGYCVGYRQGKADADQTLGIGCVRPFEEAPR